MENKIFNFTNTDKKISVVNKEINDISEKKYLLIKEKNEIPFLDRGILIQIENDISKYDELLKIKKEQRVQLMDERNYFISKLFWNLIVPILVSIIITFYVNYLFYKS